MLPSTDALLDGLLDWVRIETHTPDTAGLNSIMDLVQSQAEGFGATCQRFPGRDGKGDHLLVLSPWGDHAQKGVLLLSHLDTVHPRGTIEHDLPIRIEEDRCFGPGICDMKGGAFNGLAAMRAIAESGVTPPLPARILFTSDEEVGSPTSRSLIEDQGKHAKYALVTEPARNGGHVVTARKGVGRFTLKVEGRPSHAGARHWQGRSAVTELAHQIIALEAMTDYDREITVNVGEITGGTGTNVVPQFAQAEIDLRVPTAEAADEMVARITGLTPKTPDTKLTITGGMNRPPFEQSDASKALFDHASTLAAEIGFELVGEKTGGGSDGNFIADRIPTLDGLGPDGDDVHTLNEHIFVSSLKPRMLLLKRLMETLS
ncbi:MAG: carboxypeptidase [Stappia sp.]|uniref:M20 family metallopeptidase n=1 Tax=Stappia sp. TaxID=1870903 RepID=UPI000C4B3591|nr:M20 family metallopeptidase [Stappia sp.]MAA97645.1 carboxypeptidase [Stappia sp.]MBM20103.1 carboxypeptidase [Stappia sp.]